MSHVLFAPLKKMDEFKRMVYGTAVIEQPDRSGEIFDYASSKPHFQKWSSEIAKATDGKSLGNVRAMHGNIVAGKLVDVTFDDARKAIDVAAKIIDDVEWKKCTEGLYTGFSIGGKYLKRWADGDLKRYTAQPGEISIVDFPCVPSVSFEIVKSNGMALTKFFQAQALPALPARSYRDLPIGGRSMSIAELRKRARHAEMRAFDAGHSISGVDDNHFDPDRRIEIGECETSVGRVLITHDRGNDALAIHGVHVTLDSIDKDLAAAFVTASANFSAATTDLEQTGQRNIVAIVVDGVLRRHQFLTAQVTQQLRAQRYNV